MYICSPLLEEFFAGVVKLVDTLDLGSSALDGVKVRVPFARTKTLVIDNGRGFYF